MTASSKLPTFEPDLVGPPDYNGKAYMLPSGWTWLDVVEQRAKWSVRPGHMPCVLTRSIVAWGTVLDRQYVQIARAS